MSDLKAQRTVEYRQLAAQNERDPLSFNRIILPGTSDSTVTMAVVFSLPYSYLPFKKAQRSAPEQAFYSTAELSMEIFKSKKSSLKRDKNISVKGLESAGRAFWTDTVFAKSYEESQSRHHFATGYLKTSLEPGIYSYLLQMRRGGEDDRQISRTQSLRLQSYSKMEQGNVIIGKELLEEPQTPQLMLSEMGQNVKYGNDFYSLIYLPQYDKNANYSLEITNLQVSDDDTSRVRSVYSQKLTSPDIRTNIIPMLSGKNDEKTRINLKQNENGYTYALVKIPNSKLPNALYRLNIQKEDQKQAVAGDTFRSVWVDIPNSLLSLDVAINMLRYIVDEKTINRLSTGTEREREQKFREFWKKKDPSPKTHYNELMAEYYQRVDYAYKNFSTKTTLGYNSDQGKIYIKFGPPNEINRKFPTNKPTVEIWTYDKRKFVFRATSGFGDFKLVSNEPK